MSQNATPHAITNQIISSLQEHDLYDMLPEIVKELEGEVYRGKEISVISAVALSETEKKELEKTLQEKWNEHPFVYTVDPVILSGMIIKFEDKIIDMSGRGKLTDLEQELK